jgi:hypothetical protein
MTVTYLGCLACAWIALVDAECLLVGACGCAVFGLSTCLQAVISVIADVLERP